MSVGKRSKNRRHYHKKYYKSRGLDDSIYKNFRSAVKERDGHKCQWPGCSKCKKLEVHHILRWSEYPSLRFERSNGITLCKFHHGLIKNCEDYYIDFFRKILELQLLCKLKGLQDESY
jgi:predicted restriction endonuclease